MAAPLAAPAELPPGANASQGIQAAKQAGDLAFRQRKYQAAAKAYRRAYDLGLTQPPVAFRIAYCFHQGFRATNDPELHAQAMDYYGRAISLAKGFYPEAQYNAALALYEMQRFTAIPYRDRKTDALVTPLAALPLLTQLLSDYRTRQANAEGGADSLSLKSTPTYVYALYLRGLTLEAIGDYVNARNDLISFLERGGKGTIYERSTRASIAELERELRQRSESAYFAWWRTGPKAKPRKGYLEGGPGQLSRTQVPPGAPGAPSPAPPAAPE